MGNSKVPDAWDDDWEMTADRAELQEPVQQSAAAGSQAAKSKAQRLAEHRELNRQIWQEAEAPPEVPFHVAASNSVPFTQGFKPQMKLLSRKPMIKTRDPVTGLEKLTLADDDEDDEADKKPQPTAEEIKERQQREREEKERSYDEARARIFGDSPSGTPSGASTPGTTTPPLTGEGGGRGSYRGRGRGRGGRGGRGGQRNDSFRNESKGDIQEPRRQVNNNGSPYRELFDPDAGSRPSSRQQRGGATASPTRGPESAIRNPRGPDNSGRGGFGFARRGAKEG